MKVSTPIAGSGTKSGRGIRNGSRNMSGSTAAAGNRVGERM
jgi:hypothetical protein